MSKKLSPTKLTRSSSPKFNTFRQTATPYYHRLIQRCRYHIKWLQSRILSPSSLYKWQAVEIFCMLRNRKTSRRLAECICSVRQYPQPQDLSFGMQGRDFAHWEMVKNGTKYAGNLQTGTSGEMDLQIHGMPQQRDDHPDLVPGKSGSGEKLLLLAAASVWGGIPAESFRSAGLCGNHATAADTDSWHSGDRSLLRYESGYLQWCRCSYY